MASWDEVLKGGVSSVMNAGADVLRAQSDAAGRANNAPVTPEVSTLTKYQPLLIWGGVGLLAVVLIMAFKRR